MINLFFNIKDLCVAYNGYFVLLGVSFRIKKGEFIAIAGPNGAGKSTLLRTLAGLKQPNSGSIQLDGRALSDYPRRFIAKLIAVIFQDFSCSYDFTVFDIVAMGRNPFLTRWKPLSVNDRAIIANVMELTKVSHLSDRLFFDLSSGEKQRVIIAKALAQQPALLLLDEPSTHLDLHHQVNVFNILGRLNRLNNVTVVCITHDVTLAAQYANRFLLLSSGRLLADGTAEEVIHQQLMENLFNTALSIGMITETHTPYILPIRNKCT